MGGRPLGRGQQPGEVLAGQVAGECGLAARVGAAEIHQRGHEVQVGRDGPAAPAPGVARVYEDQRHLVLLAVGGRALAVQPVRAVEVTVIGREHDDRVRSQSERVERVQQRHQVAVGVAQAVQVVVVPPAPPPCLVLVDAADQAVVRTDVVEVRGRPARRVQRLPERRRQLEPPLLRIERVIGFVADVAEQVLRLRHLAGPVGVQEHDVVRIDQVHGQEPGFALGRQILAAAAQPAHAHRGRDRVVQVAAAVVRDDVADADVVTEAVGLHLAGEDPRRRGEFVDGLELLGQVPLALVGGVVAGLAQAVADGADVGRQAADPGEVRVVEHLRVLDVAAGVEHRTRRRAHAGIDAVVLEPRAQAQQPLVPRQPEVGRQFAGPEVALLVGEDEQDVVRARPRGRTCRAALRARGGPCCRPPAPAARRRGPPI